jgi:hypothetical protein
LWPVYICFFFIIIHPFPFPWLLVGCNNHESVLWACTYSILEYPQCHILSLSIHRFFRLCHCMWYESHEITIEDVCALYLACLLIYITRASIFWASYDQLHWSYHSHLTSKVSQCIETGIYWIGTWGVLIHNLDGMT